MAFLHYLALIFAFGREQRPAPTHTALRPWCQVENYPYWYMYNMYLVAFLNDRPSMHTWYGTWYRFQYQYGYQSQY